MILAAAAAKKVQRVQKKRVGQIHTNTHFFRPKTLVLARKPKYERTSIAKDNKMDAYAVIKKPVVTEAAMKKIEVGCSILKIMRRTKASSPSSSMSVPTSVKSLMP